MASSADRALLDAAEDFQRYISEVIASQTRQVEPPFMVLKQEFQDTDIGETDVKQAAHPVPSPVARGRR